PRLAGTPHRRGESRSERARRRGRLRRPTRSRPAAPRRAELSAQAGIVRRNPPERKEGRTPLLPHELAQRVRLERAQQAELYAEATRLGPAHDGRQRDLLLRGRQADPNAELLPELHGLTRGHEHASDADVASMTVEDTGVGALAAHAGVDGDPWVNTLFEHG